LAGSSRATALRRCRRTPSSRPGSSRTPTRCSTRRCRAGPTRATSCGRRSGLPFIAALQDLAPHERAAIVLRDALGFDAEEAAGILGTSVGALAGTLRRARADFERRLVPRSADRAPAAGSPPERRIVQRFAVAFEGADVDAILALLTDDAGLTMPPQPGLWRGREAVGTFLRTVPAGGALERFRLLTTRANGQPAFGVYLDRRASGILVLTLAGEAISAITLFHGACLVGPFGLPDAVGG
jgi:RNA polymerase sigma-70 factor (ECF subfamily)